MTAGVQRPVLQRGATGNAVQELQKLLQSFFIRGALPIDGIFGEVTELQVKTFQYIFFLKRDGIVGARTWTSLLTRKPPTDLPVLRQGSQSDWVSRVQDFLAVYLPEQKQYYPGRIDGIFGAQTEAAVREFQQDKRLTADGIVGARTYETLSLYRLGISNE
ncbi:MAG: peptidoglycan-binding protein [Oculatellaceae cyanobacterium Prado106]|jgi:peptidoglycan hydrolase-like protein with peptidoglycan-binding domain|nr:peptidoglycan-binding protein [Oculatellaceae cyanobacterium Prado106]